MSIWLMIGAFFAAVYYLIDWLFRRRKWNDNTPLEKKSLIIAMACQPAYALFSVFGVFVGAFGGGLTELSQILHQISTAMGAFIWLVTLAVSFLSILLRKLNKPMASCLVHLLAGSVIVLDIILMILSDITSH